MSTLSEQLLKAGLVTKEQVEKAAEKPKKSFHNKKNTIKKTNNSSAKKKKPLKQKEQSDLAKFYNERSKIENKEKQEAIRKKHEAAQLKKEINARVNKLITDNLLNDDAAEIRYNFVVGTTIKYVFVTEQQQQDLSDRKLAITFLGGKRSLIPFEIGGQILKINPQKIVIVANQD